MEKTGGGTINTDSFNDTRRRSFWYNVFH